jgi:TatD DNase family protein
MRLIDTHCHLNDFKAFPDPVEVVEEAREAGVDRLVVVGIDEEWSRLAVSLAERFSGVYAAVGWHPSHSPQYTKESLVAIRDLASHPKVVAIGEIGYDFYWKEATRAEQDACLFDHLDLAEELGLPVIFHCREANDDLLSVLETRRPGVPLLFHCFSGDFSHFERAVALDCWFGFDGPITYPKNDDLRKILARAPRNRILLETDAPWLTPVPYRGKRNRPSYLSHIAAKAAESLSMTKEELAALTTANAEALFRLDG